MRSNHLLLIIDRSINDQSMNYGMDDRNDNEYGRNRLVYVYWKISRINKSFDIIFFFLGNFLLFVSNIRSINIF